MPKQKSSHPRQELLQIEKRIYRQNQQLIEDSVDVYDPHFEDYQKHYRQQIKKYKRRATLKQVIDDIGRSKVVLMGDYHTLDQSQRSFVRFMRSTLKNKSKQIVVALETIQNRHQKYLDDFMLSKIDKDTFIRKIGFKNHWYFDLWPSYEIIFDFLKFHNVPTFGIETSSQEKRTLLERDDFMAEKIVSLAKRYPDKIIFVLVGDLHLAPKHLSKALRLEAKKQNIKLPVITLYQNSPQIYWTLSEKQQVDHTLIVKLSDKTYCRMNTPPIIVQQSYINWLYHEEGRFDWIDAKLSFLNIVERVAKVLDLKLPQDYENVEVYTCGDLSFMKFLRQKSKFTATELQFIRSQIESSQSYFLPEQRIAYIANVSIHHAAEEASHYLKILSSGIEIPRGHKDAFYANVLHEALGFFGSKLINNKRKCPRTQDFMAEKRFLENSGLRYDRPVEYEATLLFLEQMRLLKKKELFHTNKIKYWSQELFLRLSHALGYDLGDRLYYGFMSRDISKDHLKDLFLNPFTGEGEPGQIYQKTYRMVSRVKRPRRL